MKYCTAKATSAPAMGKAKYIHSGNCGVFSTDVTGFGFGASVAARRRSAASLASTLDFVFSASSGSAHMVLGLRAARVAGNRNRVMFWLLPWCCDGMRQGEGSGYLEHSRRKLGVSSPVSLPETIRRCESLVHMNTTHGQELRQELYTHQFGQSAQQRTRTSVECYSAATQKPRA